LSKEQPIKYSKQRENNSALWENLSRRDQQTLTAGQSFSSGKGRIAEYCDDSVRKTAC